MVAENELEIAIKNTQALFIKIISKPKCTNKLLTKPPFRFIHDIVTSTLKSTGFPHRYFTTQELDSHNFNDKNSKVAFLEKLIYLVSAAKGIPLDVRPSKIVAGLDPLNTNALLLAFGSLAIDETVQKDRLIEYCINGGKIGQMPLKLESSLEKDEEQMIIHQVPAESKASKDSKEITSTTSSSQEHDSQDQSLEHNSDIQHTQAILNSLISKPKCTEKLLAKPPFRFIHDVVMAVDKASFMGLDKVLRCDS
jgi:TRAF3-interacting protein 1